MENTSNINTNSINTSNTSTSAISGAEPGHFQELLKLCEEKRLVQLGRLLEADQEYMTLNDQYNTLYKRIMELLPQSMHSLLSEFDSVCTGINVMHQDFFYRSGFNDYVTLVQTLFGGTGHMIGSQQSGE